MVAVTDIGTLITTPNPDPNPNPLIQGGKGVGVGGRPTIAGTRTSVRRLAVLYKQGASAEEIARRMTHLSLAQVYAALTYYHANRDRIEADLAEEEAEYWKLAAASRDRAP
ncbi:MAG: DUF433 domain-containing protein [Cyanobacteriota bacterium]|nr:DUF433 domain-containing protein [Cyanobacteriota bacterium]